MHFQPPAEEQQPSAEQQPAEPTVSGAASEVTEDAPGTRPEQAPASPSRKTTTPRKSTTPRKAATPRKTTSTKPSKSTPRTKAPIPEQSTPAEPELPAAELAAVEFAAIESPALARTPESAGPTITARLFEHPGFTPELLALAAVNSLGPAAQSWVRRTRASYPTATADGLARLVSTRFVRLAGASGAASAAAGLFAPLAELAAVSWTQAALVLHLAAAHGQDPTDPERAVDLLVLAQVHPDDQSARSALAAALAATPDGDGGGLHRVAEAGWRLAAPLAAQAGGWLVLRLAARLLPGAAMLAAAAGDSAAAQRLAARAVARYRAAAASAR